MFWFAVITKPRNEALATENLRRQGFECRFLRMRRHLRGAIGMREHIEPVFPRYLFIRSSADNPMLAKIRSTRGVIGMVRFGLEPARIADQVIKNLDARADHDGIVRLDAPELMVGDQVKITQGPMFGMDAIFVKKKFT